MQMCALAGGKAKCFGANLLGASTGQHSYDRGLEASDMGRNLPTVDLDASCGVHAVTTGAYHACALLESGAVKCWGSNRSGELGQGDTNNRTAGAHELGSRLAEVDLGRRQKATMISAGLGFTCALLESGAVKCWGDNSYGQLGVGDAVNHGDDPGEMGDALPAVALGTGRSAKFIAAGHAHACAILDDGTSKCWGLNNSGQLGQGDLRGRGALPTDMGDALLPVDLGTGHHAKSLSVGPSQTCALLENKALKCWGNNSYGNLGLGDSNARGDGPSEMGGNLPAIDLGYRRYARSVAIGGGFTCAVLDDSKVKCWGNNQYGTLGLGDRVQHGASPGEMGDALPAVNLGSRCTTVRRVTATFLNACAELDNGELKCWGSGASGMLGIGPSNMRGDQASDMGDHLPSFDLGSCGIESFANGFGYHYGCALLSNGTVKCWGANSYGQLGSDRSSHAGDEPGDMGSALADVQLGTGRTVAGIAPGYYHSCALLDGGEVKCWGANFTGSLGQGDSMRRDGRASYMGDHLPKVDLGTGRTATLLVTGADHSCAILDNGAVKCWGDNSKGELGLGDTNDRGDAAGEMGDALGSVDLGVGRSAKALSLGFRHSCALLDDDSIKCWGWNLYQQCGNSNDLAGDVGDGPGEMGDVLHVVSLGSKKPIAVFAGYDNTCALLGDGGLKCWGENSRGQLGLGDGRYRGSLVADMGDALPELDFGAGGTVLKVAMGAQRQCVLLDDQSVKCWGYGGYGALGYGDLLDRGGKPGQMGEALPSVDFGADQPVLDLASSWYDTCVQLGQGVKCWGNNQMGQLGRGDTIDRGGRVAQMGELLGYTDLGL
jgi:alpha-tubulin suppressor-like RCC1 family protein